MYLLDWSVDTLYRSRLLSYFRGSPGVKEAISPAQTMRKKQHFLMVAIIVKTKLIACINVRFGMAGRIVGGQIKEFIDQCV